MRSPIKIAHTPVEEGSEVTAVGSVRPDPQSSSRHSFDAFISYSHAMDRPVAAALQSGLHRLAKPWYRVRALRVFRDDTSLSANPHLWGAIKQGLLTSRYFLLMASPDAAKSEWVQREIDCWQRYRSPETFLIVVTDGHLHWDRNTGDFDWSTTTALPQQLSGWFPDEPLWVLLDGARRDTQLSLRNTVFRAAVCKLAAPLRGVASDELDGEDVRQYRLAARLRRAAVAALTLLLTIAVALGIVAAQQRSTAIEQRDLAIREARIALARGLAAEADAIAGRDPILAARLAVTAYRQDAGPQAIAAMMRAVERHRHDVGFVERATQLSGGQGRTFGEARAGNAQLSPDGRTLAVAGRQTGEVRLWDVISQRQIDTLHSDFGHTGEPPVRISFTTDGSRLTVIHPVGVAIWELADRKRVLSRKLPNHKPYFVSSDGSTLGLYQNQPDHTASAFLTSTDSPDAELKPIGEGPAAMAALDAAKFGDLAEAIATLRAKTGSVFGFAVAATARRAVTLSEDSILEMWDLSSGQSTARRQLPGSTGKWSTAAISGDGRTVMIGDDQGQLVVLDEGLTQTIPLSQLPATVISIDLSRDGSLAVAVDNGGNVLLLRPTVDRRFDVLPGTAGRIGQEGSPAMQALTSTPDGRWLLIHLVGRVELWNLVEKRKTADFETDVEVSQLALQPPATAFNPDGTRFAIRAHGRVTAREVNSLREVGSTPTNQDPVQIAGAFATVLGGGAHLVRSDTGGNHNAVVTVDQHQSRVFVTGSGTRRGLMGTRPGDVVAVAAPQNNPDLGEATYQISVWSLGGTGAERIGGFNQTGSIRLGGLAVSRDGRYVLIDWSKPEADVVDLDSGRRTRLAGGKDGGSLSEYIFIADGRLLVEHVAPDRDSNELRNRLLLWHPSTGTLLGEWAEPIRLRYPGQQQEYLVAAGADAVLTIRTDGSIAAWRFSPDTWADRLCDLAGDLDPAQQERYLPESFRRPVC